MTSNNPFNFNAGSESTDPASSATATLTNNEDLTFSGLATSTDSNAFTFSGHASSASAATSDLTYDPFNSNSNSAGAGADASSSSGWIVSTVSMCGTSEVPYPDTANSCNYGSSTHSELSVGAKAGIAVGVVSFVVLVVLGAWFVWRRQRGRKRREMAGGVDGGEGEVVKGGVHEETREGQEEVPPPQYEQVVGERGGKV